MWNVRFIQTPMDAPRFRANGKASRCHLAATARRKRPGAGARDQSLPAAFWWCTGDAKRGAAQGELRRKRCGPARVLWRNLDLLRMVQLVTSLHFISPRQRLTFKHKSNVWIILGGPRPQCPAVHAAHLIANPTPQEGCGVARDLCIQAEHLQFNNSLTLAVIRYPPSTATKESSQLLEALSHALVIA